MPSTLRREPDLIHGFVNAVWLGGAAGAAFVFRRSVSGVPEGLIGVHARNEVATI